MNPPLPPPIFPAAPPTGPRPSVTLSVDDVLFPYTWCFYAAFLAAFLLTPLMRHLAIHWGVVDRPDGLRKIHRAPVAYFGGLAVFAGWVAGVTTCTFTAMHNSGKAWFQGITHVYVPPQLVGGAFLIVLLGLWDDVLGVTPRVKILGQVLVALLLLWAGIGDDITRPFIENVLIRYEPRAGIDVSEAFVNWAALLTSGAFTIALVVFCCNASNLMDGLDGLCGGVTAIIAVGLLALAVNQAQNVFVGDWWHTNWAGLRVVVGLSLLGAVLGFVPFNFNPASIFMGDAGSLFLGFTCALMILMLGEVEARWLLAALVMFSLPVLDTALAFARRLLAGRPVFSADKQHFHHQLVARGLSVKQAVLVAYGLAVFFVLCGLVMIVIRTRYAAGFYMVLFGFIVVSAYKIGMIHERPIGPAAGVPPVPPEEDAEEADDPEGEADEVPTLPAVARESAA